MMREVMIRRFRRALKEQASSDLSDEDSLNPAETEVCLPLKCGLIW